MKYISLISTIQSDLNIFIFEYDLAIIKLKTISQGFYLFWMASFILL